MDSNELQELFNQIDDNLALKQIVTNAILLFTEKRTLTMEQVPLLDLLEKSGQLKLSTAPLRPTQSERGLRGFLYRFVNLPVKLFFREEITFNRDLRDFINDLVVSIIALQDQNTKLITVIESLDQKITAIENSLNNPVPLKNVEIENLNSQVEDFITRTKSLTNRVNELERIINQHPISGNENLP